MFLRCSFREDCVPDTFPLGRVEMGLEAGDEPKEQPNDQPAGALPETGLARPVAGGVGEGATHAHSLRRHCEEHSDEAIQSLSAEGFWIASAFAKGFGGQVAALAMTV